MPEVCRKARNWRRPLFTPTTKSDTGHDEPMTKAQIVKLIGLRIAQEMEEKSLAVYEYARDYALSKGIIIADTKFEFGIDNGRLILIDEAADAGLIALLGCQPVQGGAVPAQLR